MTSQKLIERIDRWLATNRSEFYSRLRPGVTDAALDDFEKRFLLRLPESFRQFYKWRDGQSGFESLQGNRMAMSLGNIVETKELLDGMIETDFEDLRWWRRGWVPFLENGGGDHLCLDLVAEDGGHAGQLVAFWHADSDRPIKYPDFDAWLCQLGDSMENGTLKLI